MASRAATPSATLSSGPNIFFLGGGGVVKYRPRQRALRSWRDLTEGMETWPDPRLQGGGGHDGKENQRQGASDSDGVRPAARVHQLNEKQGEALVKTTDEEHRACASALMEERGSNNFGLLPVLLCLKCSLHKLNFSLFSSIPALCNVMVVVCTIVRLRNGPSRPLHFFFISLLTGCSLDAAELTVH